MMGDREYRDVLRDAMAIVAANVHESGSSQVLALRVIRTHDGESVVDWIERVAALVDILGAVAASYLDKWSGHLTIDADEALRIFATQLESASTARDLADGTNNEGNTP